MSFIQPVSIPLPYGLTTELDQLVFSNVFNPDLNFKEIHCQV